MSIINKTMAACSKCGARHEINIYRSINVSLDPELKAKVKDGSVFVWRCPDCGEVNLVKYECLYHDPERKLMIWLIPGGELPETEMKSILNHSGAMGGYTLRRVSDVTSLMEKVMILDEGLDDVVVEMCKWVTKAEMASKAGEEKAPEVLALPMHFYKLGEQGGEKFITLSFPDGGRMVGCNIGFNVYEDCLGILQRNPSVRPEEGFSKVDADWLMSVLQ